MAAVLKVLVIVGLSTTCCVHGNNDAGARRPVKGYKLHELVNGTGEDNCGQIQGGHSSDIRDALSGSFTLVMTGSVFPRRNAVLLSAFVKAKILPLFELSFEPTSQSVVVRYLGEKSFQRITLQVNVSETTGQLMLRVSNNMLAVMVDCHQQDVRMRQRIKALPSDVKLFLGCDESHSSRATSAVLFPGDELQPNRCQEDASVQSDEGINDSSLEDRVLVLERQIAGLVTTVEQQQMQTAALTVRVQTMESCECKPRCSHAGEVYRDLETWNQGVCTVCVCKSGRPICRTRVDLLSCRDPCYDVRCENGGRCVSMGTPGSAQCVCRAPYDGPSCSVRRNPCVWLPEPGPCDQSITRYYYDQLNQSCQPFMYSGCGGNPNNYETLEECERTAMTGACCYRKFSIARGDIIGNTQLAQTHCQMLEIGDCQVMHHWENGDSKTEVISFYPGLPCEEAGCREELPNGCTVSGAIYQEGETIKVGCDDCVCESPGKLTCSCNHLTTRKELRHLTREELVRLQLAIYTLRSSHPISVWEGFRDDYMSHGMHANGGSYFLPWHRTFLRQLERRLQEIDCRIFIPYFDFSTDVGDFAEAVIWQPNYFGGDGFGGCVPDHPFGEKSAWTPCITRHFNRSVQLPTMAELALALASEDYNEMSMCLETFVAYVHNFVGGDLGTSASVYDPVFLVIHAYVDMLYWKWQEKNSNKFKFPAALASIPMEPFYILPINVLDSERDLCVTYNFTSNKPSCNMPAHTELMSDVDKLGPILVYDDSGYNQFGYNADGFDRGGRNPLGFKNDGFNRNGFDRNGFDVEGYNRFGLDLSGKNHFGFDTVGFDSWGNADTSGIFAGDGFSDECMDRNGASPNGLDKYGIPKIELDVGPCNGSYLEPLDAIESQLLSGNLFQQDKQFLMSIPRLCPPLSPLSPAWYQQYWITSTKNVTGLITTQIPAVMPSLSASRFCFDTSVFLPSCSCKSSVATCTRNPCLVKECPAYPFATCHVDFCGECKADWKMNGIRVDCEKERDFCEPNPCQHGGRCVQSRWQHRPDLVTCHCGPGYDGPHCQYPALEVCSLPKITGDCSNFTSRWFYNQRTQSCQEFLYSGCGGNSNNFLTEETCSSRCEIGACCFRTPLNHRATYGYSRQGYDKYGFNVDGVNQEGENRSDGVLWFDAQGYDWQGYDKAGFDFEGYNRYGYDKAGFDREGFNRTGYSGIGEYDGIIDYNEDGFDEEGFNRAGFSCQGYTRDHLDAYGTSAGFSYRCRSMPLAKCQEIEADGRIEVVKFSAGMNCVDVVCEETCGCTRNNHTYKPGEAFTSGCEECMCSDTGAVRCKSMQVIYRKEFRDLTREDIRQYQSAVQQLHVGYPSPWLQLAEIYSLHQPQVVGNPAGLHWNRYFLRLVEQRLRDVFCNITVPYYDWSVDAGAPYKSIIWAVNMFGGNSQDASGCVTQHPFQKLSPWYPCLRRHFNTSVHLPTAVDIELLLREPSFDKFRLKLEVFSNLYRLFVGGHMTSDIAPYDPLFISHLAHLDKLWTTWQERHKEGILEYPELTRYIPLEPFKVSVDDIQRDIISVTYIPITEGAPKRIPQHEIEQRILQPGIDQQGSPDVQPGIDQQGSPDVHPGIDQQGSPNVHPGIDQQGSPNVHPGIDQQGSPSVDRVLDVLGIDVDSYDVNGYDVMGFNRDGFYLDSFNLDGFDKYGYDRSGHDRYGFDKNNLSPVGFYRNGSWTPLLVHHNLDLFDPDGYNIYGLDKFGFDRRGFDVFSFNASGFDINDSNTFFLGPMYLLIKRWAEQQLERMDVKDLRIIVRTCPGIRELPEWIYDLNWLRRGDQMEVIRHILIEQHQNTGTSYHSAERKHRIWRPEEPVDGLCFAPYYYSSCPLERPPKTCIHNLCSEQRCAGFSDALCRTGWCGDCYPEWYDRLTGDTVECSGCIDSSETEYGEGVTWQKSECEACTCMKGVIDCRTDDCSQVACRNPVKTAGMCCPSCDGCDYLGQVYVSGSLFVPDTSSCEKCRCHLGNVQCDRVVCPSAAPCESLVTLDGECCPTCLDCGNHANATQWQETPCQWCRCVNGVVSCQKVECSEVECAHPVRPKGQCCTLCVACYYQGIIYEDGEKFKPDSCSVCRCNHGNVKCQTRPCREPMCNNPISITGECCPVCDSECNYEGEHYRHREIFHPRYNPCLNCSCTNSFVRCSTVGCPPHGLPCRRPVTKPGECCPSRCPMCSHNGIEHQNGDVWSPEGASCQTCSCDDGIVSCRVTDTCSLECRHGTVPRGRCCSPCTDCLYEGRVIPNGQFFARPGDRCQKCTCVNGNIECEAYVSCPELSCTATAKLTNGCCPICRGCKFQATHYRHQERIQTGDPCLTCICLEGQVDCKRESCPSMRCNNMKTAPGRCCPACLDCNHEGQLWGNGEVFVSRRDPCQRCRCEAGHVTCHRQDGVCPAMKCSHPVQKHGRCCQTCDECYFLKRIFKNGQKFMPPGDNPCRVCSCRDGSISCAQMKCRPALCLNPRHVLGRCCDSCPQTGCKLLGRSYREGRTFDDPRDACSTCKCQAGDIQCSTRPCPPMACSHPARLPGECCDVCNDCSLDSKLYLDGTEFQDNDNKCRRCKCQAGSVSCGPVECPELTCSDPESLPGHCCPVCREEGCTHRGQRFKEAQTFDSPWQPCKQCQCHSGQVTCRRTRCPPVSCEHPVHKECCKSCDECRYYGSTYQMNSAFPHPKDKCQECQCKSGNIRCQPKACNLLVPCSHPTIMAGECCASCQDCYYHGIRMKHSERMMVDQCSQCVCSLGSVMCQQRDCLVVDCNHPVTADCCPHCSDCLYDGITIRDGQTFQNRHAPCETCICTAGSVVCERSCPEIHCQHAVQGECCPECSDCHYFNRRYRNMQRFLNPKNPCSKCVCQEGTVTCEVPDCPPISCDYPVPGECCSECTGCAYRNGRRYRDGEVLTLDDKPCDVCSCSRGQVHCKKRRCPAVRCRHPAMRGCCRECGDCFYRNREYINGRAFPDASDDCGQCSCENGNVNCQSKSCPPTTCRHPTKGACCPVCNGCSYHGNQYGDGESFQDPRDACQTCECARGDIHCSKNCPQATCSHPIRGPCCLECGGNCFHGNRVILNKEEFESNCQTCICFEGNVQCYTKYCPPVNCSNPVIEDCCRVCNDCMFEDRHFLNGQSFPDLKDTCSSCICRDGTFNCQKKPCPAVSCKNPVQGECCAECRDCSYKNQLITHGERFSDDNDPCIMCICDSGSVTCKRPPCDPVSCTHPMTDLCSCPRCTDCMFHGVFHQGNNVFTHPENGCHECQCQRGNVACYDKECHIHCSHPMARDKCCPLCTTCLYDGSELRDGESFVAEPDPCQNCTCQAGSVHCRSISCPRLTCINPVKRDGECCLQCPICNFLGHEYVDEIMFSHPEDLCQTCRCRAGRVLCEREECSAKCTHPRIDLCCPRCDDCYFEEKLRPNGEIFRPDVCRRCRCDKGNIECQEQQCTELTCLLKEKVPGECCERCQGCMYKGVHYDDSSKWILDDNPCVSCMCHGGIITCAQVRCMVPCHNPVSLPGQCCPVCPTCSLHGAEYADGDIFSPNGDPCDVCSCEDGHMRCIHEPCPNVAHCPTEQLIPASPGHCCASCAGFGTNCTHDQFGTILRPRSDDPCFYCECKESFNWICMKDVCPLLNCPEMEQREVPESCCPECPACFSASENAYFDEDDQWTDSQNPCISCQCRSGDVQCSIQECPPIKCHPAQQLTKVPGECCEFCQALEDATCIHRGRTRQAGERWLPDECTDCECIGGKANCIKKSCPFIPCGPEETPSISPGLCCPVCLPNPATCLVFGDPHYRTFDGATFHFQGTCKYIMATECDTEEFLVEVQHDSRGEDGVSWAQNFTVTLGRIVVDLMQQHVVQVNGRPVDLPFLYGSQVYIERSGNTVLLNTDIGVKILWDGQGYAELSVPGSYKRRLCGLCGNFNGFPQDDLKTRTGQITNSPAIFGNTWKAKTQYNEDCQSAKDIDPCSRAGYRARKLATTKCAIIMGQAFSRCHRVVSPEAFFASCVFDMCVCAEDPSCLCNIISSYAHECARVGVKVQWRTATLCAFGCSEDRGLMFDECGPVCPRTCDNRNTPLGNVTENCFKPCVASCQCLADKVLHDGSCIDPDLCEDK